MNEKQAMKYGLLALKAMGFEEHVLEEFEAEMNYIIEQNRENTKSV